jgi:hypothetical protein
MMQGNRSDVIGIDQNGVLDIHQWAALQLAGKSPTVTEILVQPPREQSQRIAVAQLRSRAQPVL